MSDSLSTSVNSGIPLAAKAPDAPNPLQQIGQFAQVQAQMNQNRLFPGQQQLQQQQIDSGQSSLMQQQRQLGAASLAPLLVKKGLVNLDDVTTALAGAEKGGVVTQPILSSVLSVPMTGDPNTDDASLRSFILANSQPPQTAARAVTPSQESIDYGPGIQPGTSPAPGMPGQGAFTPAGGAVIKGVGPQYVQTGAASVPTNGGQPTGPGIPNQPGAGERNQLNPVWNPSKAAFDYVPRQNVAPMYDGSGQPITPPVPGLPSSGRINPPQGAAPATPSGTAPAAPSGGYTAQSSVPLGSAAEAEASALHLGQARERANNYQASIYPIEGALTALQGADTGRGSSVLNSVHAVVQDLTPQMFQSIMPSIIVGDPEKRQAYEEANKYLTAMAVNTPGGSRSDSGQAAAMNATPNTHISNAAAQQVVLASLAQQRLQQAGTLAFNQANLPANQYDRFMNTWNTQQDPRAYIADKLPPQDRAAIVRSMGGTQSPAYQKFKASFLQAQQTGVMNPPAPGQ